VQIRRLLVPLVGSDNDQLVLDVGFGLARDLSAHVDALFVRPDPEDAVPYLGMDVGNLEEIRDEYRKHAEVIGKKTAAKSRRRFNAACKKQGIAKAKRPSEPSEISARWIDVVGSTTREMAEAARFCDISVFAGPPTDYHRLFPNVLECTLLESGRPLLFVPDSAVKFPPERVAIAWDASIPAVRAVGAAGTFLRDAKDIQVLSIEEQYEDTADPQKVVEYLAWHGLNAEGRVIPRAHEEVGHALLAAAQKTEASLLIMGGYAHNRFEEAVFGGTTLHVMRHTPVPLLMMH